MLTTYNPNSKWDWYAIGGRRGGMLKLRSSVKVDQARLNQLDPTQRFFSIFDEVFFTYAVITEDGEWHEMDKMGWWGCSSETDEEKDSGIKSYWDRFMEGLSGDTLLTIVDCHI